jgi:hypothetical protein
VCDLLEENRRLLAEARACLRAAAGQPAVAAAALAAVNCTPTPLPAVQVNAVTVCEGTPKHVAVAGGPAAIMASPTCVDGSIANGGAAPSHQSCAARSDTPAPARHLDLHDLNELETVPTGGSAIATFKTPLHELCAVASRLRAALSEASAGLDECEPVVLWAAEACELGCSRDDDGDNVCCCCSDGVGGFIAEC